MIPQHMEPKGLSPSAPHSNSRSFEIHTKKAERGSRRLRNAIWKLQGYQPPIKRTPLCPACLMPISHKRTLIADIQQSVAAFYGLTVFGLLSRDNRRLVAKARQQAMFLANEFTDHSIAEIGRRFKRDHTTVLHALKAVPRRAETDEQEAFDVSLLRERIAA